jgi:hypothetical protein
VKGAFSKRKIILHLSQNNLGLIMGKLFFCFLNFLLLALGSRG